MSATNSTTNYNLPVFIGTDKPAWLTDWNGAMNTIDSTIASVSNAQQGDATSISGLQSSVSSLSDTVGGHTTAITSLNTAVTGNTGSINTINSLIGNGEPTTTDKTIIGAINELNAEIVPVQELTASNVPIAQIAGVTADDVQEALEAINAKITTGVSMTKLWENSDLTQDFASGTITLSSGDYDLLLCIALAEKGTANEISVIVQAGKAVYLNFGHTGSDHIAMCERILAYTDSTHLSAGNCTRAYGDASPATNNSFILPAVIYGIKF